MSTPAVEVRAFAVTIPAGTPEASPVTQDIFFPVREVTAVSWKVPPGPSGLMGWRLTMSGGNPVVPAAGGWIVADGQADTWPLQDLPDSGAWEVTGYNTGAYDHTVYLTFLLDLVTSGPATTPQLASAAISNPPPSTITAASTPAPVTVTSAAAVPPVTVTGVTVPAPVTVSTATVPPPVTVSTVSTPPPVTITSVTVPPPVTVTSG